MTKPDRIDTTNHPVNRPYHETSADRVAAECIIAADALGFSAEDIEKACRNRFDTDFAHMKPSELRRFRDELRELKLSETRPVNRYWDKPGRDEALERKARAKIAEDIRKRDGVVLGRDPIGTRRGPQELGEGPEQT